MVGKNIKIWCRNAEPKKKSGLLVAWRSALFLICPQRQIYDTRSVKPLKTHPYGGSVATTVSSWQVLAVSLKNVPTCTGENCRDITTVRANTVEKSPCKCSREDKITIKRLSRVSLESQQETCWGMNDETWIQTESYLDKTRDWRSIIKRYGRVSIINWIAYCLLRLTYYGYEFGNISCCLLEYSYNRVMISSYSSKVCPSMLKHPKWRSVMRTCECPNT